MVFQRFCDQAGSELNQDSGPRARSDQKVQRTPKMSLVCQVLVCLGPKCSADSSLLKMCFHGEPIIQR